MNSRKQLLEMIINKCETKHFNISADWLQRKSNIPYLKLGINIPTDIIYNEIKNIEHLFVEHREQYNEHYGWQSFSIHGKSYDSTREDEYYNDDRPHIWTNEAKDLMPNTVDFFKNNWFGNTFNRLRVMKLLPGGYVFIHSDGNLPGRLGPVNIAITQPTGCKFVFEEYGVVPFQTGDSYILNVANRHMVFNDSDEVRYHIIAHHLTATEQYNTMLIKSFNEYINETC
jgi:hypothetical protein